MYISHSPIMREKSQSNLNQILPVIIDGSDEEFASKKRRELENYRK